MKSLHIYIPRNQNMILNTEQFGTEIKQELFTFRCISMFVPIPPLPSSFSPCAWFPY